MKRCSGAFGCPASFTVARTNAFVFSAPQNGRSQRRRGDGVTSPDATIGFRSGPAPAAVSSCRDLPLARTRELKTSANTPVGESKRGCEPASARAVARARRGAKAGASARRSSRASPGGAESLANDDQEVPVGFGRGPCLGVRALLRPAAHQTFAFVRSDPPATMLLGRCAFRDPAKSDFKALGSGRCQQRALVRSR